MRLLDDFYHAGPNGHHQCLVFELLGPSIDNVINSCNPLNGEPRTADDGIDPRVVLRVSRQLLVALGILHKRSIAHGGRIVQTLLRP